MNTEVSNEKVTGFDWRPAKDPEGNFAINFKISKEVVEVIRGLATSQSWKIYRQMMISAKEGYMNAMLPMKDPCEISKTLGIVIGLNWAINQVAVIVASANAASQKRAEEDSKKNAKKQ